MYPVALDVARVPILLIGQGEALHRRRCQLEEAGAMRLTILPLSSPSPGGGGSLDAALVAARVVMIAGLSHEQSETLAAQARALGRLVNVEDVNELCDFYFTANVRRGDLLIAVSTGGASPTLARRVRDAVAALFGEEWAARTRELARLRLEWKAGGAGMQEVQARTDRYLAEQKWMPAQRDAA